ATTGPASAPRPASSMPATSFTLRRHSSCSSDQSGVGAVLVARDTELDAGGIATHLVGQREVEGAAPADLGLHPDLAAVLLDRQLAERETHAGVVAVVDGVPGLLEGVEDALLVGFRDALPVVAHAEHEAVLLLPGPEIDVAAAPRVLDGVGQKVGQYTPQEFG